MKYSFSTEGEATVVTVLYPRKSETDKIRLNCPKVLRPEAFEVEHGEYKDIVVLNNASARSVSEVSTDARVALLRLTKGGSPERILALGGSYLRFGNTTVFDSHGRSINISSLGTKVTAVGTNIGKLSVGLPGVSELILNGEQTRTVRQNSFMIFD